MMMMRCKQLALFSFNHVATFALYCCCLIQLMFLCASVKGDANSIAVSCSFNMECGKLGNITYPFWGSAACASSPSYVLSNCTSSNSTEVYWDSFSSAANGVSAPPAVIAVDHKYVIPPDLDYLNYLNYANISVQLSWNKSFIELDYCAPLFSSKSLSSYSIPSSINLTHFSELEFSTRNTFLLFNCTQYNITSNVVTQLGSQNLVLESASGCMIYKRLYCPSLKEIPCVQWSVPPKELMLQYVLDGLACSHFMFKIGSFDEVGSDASSIGSIELNIWTDIFQCSKCDQALEFCIVRTKQCECSDGTVFDLNSTRTCNNSLIYENDNWKLVIGRAVGVIIVAVLGIVVVMRFKEDLGKLCGRSKENIKVAFVSFTKVTIPIAIYVLKGVLRKLQSVSYGPSIFLLNMDFDGLTERPMEYSYSTIASATKSFKSLLGEGGFSSVYKGTLTQAGNSELQIAVKVLEVKSKHSKKQFLNEVITIGRIHHVNIVRLLGFCMQGDQEMLVYEYVVNGSLDKWLFVERANTTDKVLNWGKRYAIALGVARGLSYLHEECRHRTVHCDIKPQNILLDEDMHPKIADFGLARLMGRDESKVMTFAKGTPGYMAPEFWLGGESQLSTKFDVYSYGMVLLELISGRRNFRHDATLNSSSSFPAMAFKAAMEGDLQSILDFRLRIEVQTQAQWDQIQKAAFIALWCIQDLPARRPNMSEVVQYLEGGAPISECPPQPSISTFYGPARSSQESSSSKYENDITVLSEGR